MAKPARGLTRLLRTLPAAESVFVWLKFRRIQVLDSELLPRTMLEKLWMLPVAFTAAVCEETLFRGYALVELRRRGLPVVLAVVVSTISFTFIHGLAQAPVLLVFRVLAGLGFCGLALWRGNLRAAIVVHFLVDASLVISV